MGLATQSHPIRCVPDFQRHDGKLLEYKFMGWEEPTIHKHSIYVSYCYYYWYYFKISFKDIEVTICGVRRDSFTNRSCYTFCGHLDKESGKTALLNCLC